MGMDNNDLDELVVAAHVDLKSQPGHHNGWLASLPKTFHILSNFYYPERFRGSDSSVCYSLLG
jgi:hypothetical protein